MKILESIDNDGHILIAVRKHDAKGIKHLYLALRKDKFVILHCERDNQQKSDVL
jgi:hypothetical protein